NTSGLALVVRGTSEDDHIQIKTAGNADWIRVTIRSDDFNFSNTYPTTLFTRIIVYGLAGDDHITVASSVPLPALLSGGDGDDHVQAARRATPTRGGDGDDHVQAGGGPTVIVGGDGDDHLQGGAGLGVLIGGRGSDHLQAGSSDSILIAGYTDLVTDAKALCAVMDEWAASQTYAVRVTNLGSMLNATAVHDDGAQDHLIGGTGTDWFFVSSRDKSRRDK